MLEVRKSKIHLIRPRLMPDCTQPGKAWAVTCKTTEKIF